MSRGPTFPQATITTNAVPFEGYASIQQSRMHGAKTLAEPPTRDDQMSLVEGEFAFSHTEFRNPGQPRVMTSLGTVYINDIPQGVDANVKRQKLMSEVSKNIIVEGPVVSTVTFADGKPTAGVVLYDSGSVSVRHTGKIPMERGDILMTRIPTELVELAIGQSTHLDAEYVARNPRNVLETYPLRAAMHDKELFLELINMHALLSNDLIRSRLSKAGVRGIDTKPQADALLALAPGTQALVDLEDAIFNLAPFMISGMISAMSNMRGIVKTYVTGGEYTTAVVTPAIRNMINLTRTSYT